MKNEEIKIMWRIVPHMRNKPIQKIEVASETACYVTIKYGFVRIKKSGKVFDSFDEAKAALVLIAKRYIEDIERNLKTAQNILQKYSDFQDG